LFGRSPIIRVFNTPQSLLWGFLEPPLVKGVWGILKIINLYLKIPRCLCGGEFSLRKNAANIEER
jgi:hypothetical protein